MLPLAVALAILPDLDHLADYTPIAFGASRVTLHNVFEGHGFGKVLVPLAIRAAKKDADALAGRIKAAVDARTDPGFVVMARTDALAVEGLEAAIERQGLVGMFRIVDHCNDMPAAYMLADVVVSTGAFNTRAAGGEEFTIPDGSRFAIAASCATGPWRNWPRVTSEATGLRRCGTSSGGRDSGCPMPSAAWR